jgi:hypothetical protein
VFSPASFGGSRTCSPGIGTTSIHSNPAWETCALGKYPSAPVLVFKTTAHPRLIRIPASAYFGCRHSQFRGKRSSLAHETTAAGDSSHRESHENPVPIGRYRSLSLHTGSHAARNSGNVLFPAGSVRSAFMRAAAFHYPVLSGCAVTQDLCALPTADGPWVPLFFIAMSKSFGRPNFRQRNRQGADFPRRHVGNEDFDLHCLVRDLQLIAVKKAMLRRVGVSWLAKV